MAVVSSPSKSVTPVVSKPVTPAAIKPSTPAVSTSTPTVTKSSTPAPAAVYTPSTPVKAVTYTPPKPATTTVSSTSTSSLLNNSNVPDAAKKSIAAYENTKAVAAIVSNPKTPDNVKNSIQASQSSTQVTNSPAQGAVIRAMTPAEDANWNASKALPYIPIVNTINNIAIAATGKDLTGYYASEGEKQKAKESLVFDAGFAIMGGAAAKGVLQEANSAISSAKVSITTASVEVKAEVQQILKQPLRDSATGQFVSKPWTQVDNALKDATGTVKDVTQEAIFTQEQAQKLEEFFKTDNAGGALDAIAAALKIAAKVKK